MFRYAFQAFENFDNFLTLICIWKDINTPKIVEMEMKQFFNDYDQPTRILGS